MENLPAKQLQRMKKQLRGVIVLKITKKRLIKIAFNELKESIPGLTEVEKNLSGMPALIFTRENPFKLFKALSKNKSNAPAKPGQIAPHDLFLSAGPTPFTPGPVIGELGQLGIKTEVREGKVAIKEDKLIVGGGEKITQKVADLLTKFGMEPMEISLNLVLAFENGVIFTKDVLSVDEKVYIDEIRKIHAQAMHLAVEIGYADKATITLLLSKAYKAASSLADNLGIITDENVGKILGKAEDQARHLKEKLKL
ncbi:50S ribosomal protein L10 [Candidatus Woesearchaeota archaeon]|nr:50S ribosomal protein L10 [Candidatus Woesearchaeota archaeon]